MPTKHKGIAGQIEEEAISVKALTLLFSVAS